MNDSADDSQELPKVFKDAFYKISRNSDPGHARGVLASIRKIDDPVGHKLMAQKLADFLVDDFLGAMKEEHHTADEKVGYGRIIEVVALAEKADAGLADIFLTVASAIIEEETEEKAKDAFVNIGKLSAEILSYILEKNPEAGQKPELKALKDEIAAMPDEKYKSSPAAHFMALARAGGFQPKEEPALNPHKNPFRHEP